MNEINPPAGLRVLESLLDFITNPKKVRSAVDELNEARNAANAALSTLGKIGDADAMLADAKSKLASAKGKLRQAELDANVIRGKAGEDAAKEAGRQARADKILDDAIRKDAILAQREHSVQAREDSLQGHMDDAKKTMKAAKSLEKTAKALTQKAEDQLALFASVAAQVH